MTWYPKEARTAFDYRPIEGLYFLDGDTYSVVVERENRLGLKYPKISFPSGRTFAVEETDTKQVWVRLSEAISIPLFADRERAYSYLKTLTTPSDYLAYFVHPVDTDGVLIWGKTERERVVVTYNNSLQLIEDIADVRGEVGAYRLRGRTHHLP